MNFMRLARALLPLLSCNQGDRWRQEPDGKAELEQLRTYLGLPRIGGVLLKASQWVPESEPFTLEIAVPPAEAFTATIESWGVTFIGADAIAAGIVGSAITGAAAFAAFYAGIGLGSLLVIHKTPQLTLPHPRVRLHSHTSRRG